MRSGSPSGRASERGVIPWLVIAAIVVVVIVVAAAVTYVLTKPSGTATPPMPKVCPGGSLDLKAHLRGASTGASYTVAATATRRCELGQNCTCGGGSGSFGTPTTPCDQYDGNLGPVTASDTVPAAALVTEYTKQLGGLREGIWEVQLNVSTGTQAAVAKTCCAIVLSGQTSALEFWCQRVLLPGQVCEDCAVHTTPSGPTGVGTPVH